MTTQERIAQEYIWEDVDAFLNYIQENSPELTATYKMKGPDCSNINELLHYKEPKLNNRSKHNHHYLLWMFYKVGLGLRIIQVVPKGSKNLLKINEPLFDLWQGFDATDKYFTFLEGLICHTDLNRVTDNERAYGAASGLDRLVKRVVELDRVGDKRYKDQRGALMQTGLFASSFSSMLKLFRCLGWIDLSYTQADRYTFKIKHIEMLPLGHAIMPILATKRLARVWNDIAYQFREDEDNSNFLLTDPNEAEEERLFSEVEPLRDKEGFLDAFDSLMDEGKTIQRLPINEFRGISGVYQFKAVVEAILANNCHISIGSEATLEDLHHAILKGFGLENDHLYSFYLSEWESYDYRIDGQPRYSLEEGELKYLEEEVSSMYNFKLDKLRFAQGDMLRYEFNYSASFRVILILEEVRTDEDPKSAFTIEKKKATRGRKKK